MTALILIGVLLLFLFGFVLLFGAPYLPTLKKQVETALDLLDLKPGQKLLDLGCGDGRVMLAAARRGLKVVGYELNPLLVVLARMRTWRYRHLVKIIWANYWQADWPKTDGIFVFLLEKYMLKLDTKITQEMSATRRPNVEQSPPLRRRSLRWALLRPAILLQRRLTTPQSVSHSRLAQHQSAEHLLGKINNLKVVSYAFQIPGKKAKTIKNGLYLYKYR